MQQQIEIKRMTDHEYGVRVREGDHATDHHVRVPESLRDELGIVDLDEDQLVRESFHFLLEREPADSILREFDLDVISRYFPDYVSEIRTRLS